MREQEASFLVVPPELTTNRKRTIALHQQSFASEYVLQGYYRQYVFAFDVTKHQLQEADIYNQ